MHATSANQVTSRHCGESSTTCRPKTLSSSKADLDQERPFKKARYIWQLKGKYHLKSSASQQQSTPLHSACSNHSSDTDSDLENIPYSNNQPTTRIDKTVPITLVMPNNHTQDEYLEQWQASQMAKGYIDNTINSLLEMWKIAPFDSDVMEDLENDEQVEDEGILMAIQSHGLQTSAPALQSHSKPTDATTSHKTAAFRTANNTPVAIESVDNDDQFLSAAVSAAIKKKGLTSYSFG
ncbi:uncharacterized protein [Atheta coriaria]|uniref:uncharacterized protein n=1 Tax=Dalotia coriaria TaxID=877792 RepID=UPI0031F40E29